MDAKWIPFEYVDEGPCDLRDTPAAWLVNISDGATCLDTPDTWSGDDGEAAPPTLIKDGEIVQFLQFRKIGEATLILAEDGCWTVDNAMPPEANGAAAMHGWQYETASDDLAGVVDALKKYGAEPGEYLISYHFWSDRIALRYDAPSRSFARVEADGQG